MGVVEGLRHINIVGWVDVVDECWRSYGMLGEEVFLGFSQLAALFVPEYDVTDFVEDREPDALPRHGAIAEDDRGASDFIERVARRHMGA